MSKDETFAGCIMQSQNEKMRIYRRVDDLGRVVIPKEIRRVMNISTGDPLNFEIIGNWIAVAKTRSECVRCKAELELDSPDVYLCDDCAVKQ